MYIALFFSTWYLYHLTNERIRPLSTQLTQSFDGSVMLSRFVSTLFVGTSIVSTATIVRQAHLMYVGLLLIAWGLLMGVADIIAFQWLKRKKQEVHNFRNSNSQ